MEGVEFKTNNDNMDLKGSDKPEERKLKAAFKSRFNERMTRQSDRNRLFVNLSDAPSLYYNSHSHIQCFKTTKYALEAINRLDY